MMVVKGVALRREGLSAESLAYLEAKLRRGVRREASLWRRLVEALSPRDYRRVPIESFVQGRALVVGCSGGIETIGLGAIGLDVSLPALRVARDLGAHAEGAVSLFLAASGAGLPFRGASFDSVLSDNVVEHIPSPALEFHFREVARVLRPGGRYVFSSPNRLFETPAKEGHVSLRSYAEWERLALGSGFREVRTPRRRSGPLGDLSWKKEAESRAASSGSRLGLSHRGLRMVTLLAIR
jgi:SAM-dependent methyltransferase